MMLRAPIDPNRRPRSSSGETAPDVADPAPDPLDQAGREVPGAWRQLRWPEHRGTVAPGGTFVTVTKPARTRQAGDRCRWCGRPLPSAAPTGRPRAYCRRACRQRDYEARQRARELGLSEGELVMTRAELDGLRDQLYVLEDRGGGRRARPRGFTDQARPAGRGVVDHRRGAATLPTDARQLTGVPQVASPSTCRTCDAAPPCPVASPLALAPVSVTVAVPGPTRSCCCRCRSILLTLIPSGLRPRSMNSLMPLMVTTPTTDDLVARRVALDARRLERRVRQRALRRVAGQRDGRGSGVLSGAVHGRLDRGELTDVAGVRMPVGTSVSVESTCAPVAGSKGVTPLPVKSRSWASASRRRSRAPSPCPVAL